MEVARREAGDARKTGSRTIDGTKATRYSATVDIRDYPETVEPERREAAERTVDFLADAWGSPTHREHVWIDAGKPQEVRVPDGDDVIDVTDQLVEEIN